MKKLTFTLLFALMAIVSAQAAKVYLKIGEGQVTAESNLAVWVWEGSNNFCTNGWPGDKLTEKETVKILDSVSPDSVKRRFENKTLQKLYKRRINSWKN